MDEINAVYEEIRNLIISNSDFDWEQFVVHAIRDEFHSEYEVHYKMGGKFFMHTELVDNGTTPDKTAMLFELFDIANKLKRLAKNGVIDMWNEMIFSYKKSGEQKVMFSLKTFDDLSISDTIVYRYKYLGIMPIEKHMKYIEGVEQELL